VRWLHREVRDQEHGGGRRAPAPVVGARPRATACAPPRRADGAMRMGPGNEAASPPASTAALGPRARLPRALLHEEPPLLHDVHEAAPGPLRTPAAGGARRRTARPVGPADERRRVRGATVLGVHRHRLPDARGRLARRDGCRQGARASPCRARGASQPSDGRGPGQGFHRQCRRCVGKENEVQRERYVTAREVAERLGLSADTILRYYREGRIPGHRMPGTIRPVRFLWSEVEAAWDCCNQLELLEDHVA
jgi:excisionase family DNA binding protein